MLCMIYSIHLNNTLYIYVYAFDCLIKKTQTLVKFQQTKLAIILIFKKILRFFPNFCFFTFYINQHKGDKYEENNCHTNYLIDV